MFILLYPFPLRLPSSAYTLTSPYSVFAFAPAAGWLPYYLVFGFIRSDADYTGLKVEKETVLGCVLSDSALPFCCHSIRPLIIRIRPYTKVSGSAFLHKIEVIVFPPERPKPKKAGKGV